jgi:hypothetical protein
VVQSHTAPALLGVGRSLTAVPSSGIKPGNEAWLNQKGTRMSKVDPFYSSLTRNVYHNQSGCTEGNNIESRYRVSGTGGLPLCQHCARL